MADQSPIEWLATPNADGTTTPGATWNPTRGCSRVSAGCRHCYAEREAARIIRMDRGRDIPEGAGSYDGLIDFTSQGPKWSGRITLARNKLFDPLSYRKPRRIFVDSMSDLFHDGVPDQYITDVFGVMALSPWHTYILLTKRPQRALEYLQAGDHGIVAQFQAIEAQGGIAPKEVFKALDRRKAGGNAWTWPLPNVHIGVSIEDQPTADERLELLQQMPAAVRLVSAEPLLGRVRMDHWLATGRIHGVIVGGESGPDASPMHPLWACSLRDQCEAFGVRFFFKQWGEWGPGDLVALAAPGRSFEPDAVIYAYADGTFGPIGKGAPAGPTVVRAGRPLTGNRLEGRLHLALPGMEAAAC